MCGVCVLRCVRRYHERRAAADSAGNAHALCCARTCMRAPPPCRLCAEARCSAITHTLLLRTTQIAAFIAAFNGRWPTKNDKSSLVGRRGRRPLVVRRARWR